jgi:hypothetical protein
MVGTAPGKVCPFVEENEDMPSRVAAAVLVLSLVSTRTLSAEPVKVNGWIMNDLAGAQAEARKTGKPIFVVFRCEA